MTRRLAASVLLLGAVAWAHRIDEYLQATIFSLQSHQVEASMRLIPGVLVAPSVIASIDGDANGVFSNAEQRAYAQRVIDDLSVSIDGSSVKPRLVSWSFPQPAELRDGLGEVHISYTVDLPSGGTNRSLVVANHHLNQKSVYLMNALVPQDPDLRITAQKRNEQQSIYEIDYQQMGDAASAPATLLTWLKGMQFSSLFRLGMRHIAEGTDHLLFLLVLLLPAPLTVSGTRWSEPASVRQSLLRILAIVTAFTIGHSITLTLAAMGSVSVPSRPVEVLIAVSIFVSAVHAFRPIFAGKEALIAGFFGLIHGLAFAATLDRLGFGRWERLAGILSFNLGIETMQMLVVAVVLPSLIVMSRTHAYPLLRISGAAFGALASLAWIAERTFGIGTPVDTIVNAIAQHSALIAGGLFLLSLVLRALETWRPHLQFKQNYEKQLRT